MHPRFRRARHRQLAVAAVVLALVAMRLAANLFEDAPPAALEEGLHRVERVVDGDTLLLENGARVRLIGVDTPEVVRPNHPVEPFGPEASRFTRDFLSGGEVELRFDRERVDRFDRFLAYVYVDGELLNEELLRAGLARSRLGFRFSSSMKRKFRQAEEEARQARRGIWREAETPKARSNQ